tara:strand:- start:1282 stop:1911 length:630 start_codon:yes stop_codon:yes gene_type:complete
MSEPAFMSVRNTTLPYFIHMDNTNTPHRRESALEDHSNLLRKIRTKPAARRSTYSPTNAYKIKPILDKLLDGQKDMLITADDTGYTVNTLYVKLLDGFKFLVDNSTEYGPIYADLRTQVSFRKTSAGVLIYYKDTTRNQLKAIELQHEFADSSVWKGELLTWLQTAEEMDTFNRENVRVDTGDTKWLEDQQKLVDFEFDTGNGSLNVVR